ncbi:MAG: hypothetical protein H0U83_04410, partial [Sphingomonas sp.]|nr:hypothetical protein [Sphingomonas sp.]
MTSGNVDLGFWNSEFMQKGRHCVTQGDRSAAALHHDNLYAPTCFQLDRFLHGIANSSLAKHARGNRIALAIKNDLVDTTLWISSALA